MIIKPSILTYYFRSYFGYKETAGAIRYEPECLLGAKAIAHTGITGWITEVNRESSEHRFDNFTVEWDNGKVSREICTTNHGVSVMINDDRFSCYKRIKQ